MSDATSYQSRLLRSERVAEGTMAFHFARPEGFDFRAGQSIDLTLLNPPETDAEGNTRAFSLAGAPCDHDLMIATRMRDTAFKRVLGKASPGLEVKLEGPGGSLVLHRKAEKPAVLLAGGIGITPFLSIVRQAAHDRLPHRIYLFYANRRPVDAPFLDILATTAEENSQFHFIPVMTALDGSPGEWHGETGHITREMLEKHLPAILGPIYYVAGPPAMVASLRRVLSESGADEDDIRTEEFSGY